MNRKKIVGKILPSVHGVGIPRYDPMEKDIRSFVLPSGVRFPKQLIAFASEYSSHTLDVFGVVIPAIYRNEEQERFIAGFLRGLVSNRSGIYKPSFSCGFAWAKWYWRKFFPGNKLGMSGTFSLKERSSWPT